LQAEPAPKKDSPKNQASTNSRFRLKFRWGWSSDQ